MKLNLFVILLLSLCVFASSSAMASREKAEVQARKIASFHGISVSSGIDLILKQGSAESVVVKADQDVMDDIITKVDNGILQIYMKRNKMNWSWHSPRIVEVTFENLTKLDVSAGADAVAQNAFQLDEIKISVSSGADLKVDDLTAKSVSLDVSSGADAKLSGRVVHFEGSSSSGADLSCAGLVSESCFVNASSGADAEVNVTKKLKARASSGGDVRYKGNPPQSDIDESSGGDVNRF